MTIKRQVSLVETKAVSQQLSVYGQLCTVSSV